MEQLNVSAVRALCLDGPKLRNAKGQGALPVRSDAARGELAIHLTH
jgi:hypothetical protein